MLASLLMWNRQPVFHAVARAMESITAVSRCRSSRRSEPWHRAGRSTDWNRQGSAWTERLPHPKCLVSRQALRVDAGALPSRYPDARRWTDRFPPPPLLSPRTRSGLEPWSTGGGAVSSPGVVRRAKRLSGNSPSYRGLHVAASTWNSTSCCFCFLHLRFSLVF